MLETDSSSFVDFVADVEPKLMRALAAKYGVTDGSEATAEALAYAWEHWSSVRQMGNPMGYLYRVGSSKTRRIRRRTPMLIDVPLGGIPEVEPGLPKALSSLSERQRVSVILVTGFGWSHVEVGELLGVSPTTVQNHVQRGLEKLKRRLGEGR
jgi:DNA-directed RNA polymerase specialized sigma24 family protein